LSNKDAGLIKADSSLSDFFGGYGFGHYISNGDSLRAALKEILAVGPGYEM
jgi:hypothetical protein